MSLDRTALAKLQEVVGGDPADVAELIDSFLDEAPELLAAIGRAHAAGDVAALKRAAHSLKSAAREFGAMAAALGGVDAIVFCGGIGENSRTIRARVCERLSWIGVEVDHSRNAANASVISSEMSRVQVMVIKTNEELVIARAVRSLLASAERSVA